MVGGTYHGEERGVRNDKCLRIYGFMHIDYMVFNYAKLESGPIPRLECVGMAKSWSYMVYRFFASVYAKAFNNARLGNTTRYRK